MSRKFRVFYENIQDILLDNVIFLDLLAVKVTRHHFEGRILL